MVFVVLHLLVISTMRKCVAPFTLLFKFVVGRQLTKNTAVEHIDVRRADKKPSTELRRQWDFLCEGNEKTITSTMGHTSSFVTFVPGFTRELTVFTAL